MRGKLKKTLKERCPECGKVLELRSYEVKSYSRGREVSRQQEYICCSNHECYYERGVEPKRVRRRSKDEEYDLDDF